MERQNRLIGTLNSDMRLLEVGPGYNPLLPKAKGWKTTIVDHGTRTDLVKKYQSHNVNVDAIEEVDVVWKRLLLHEDFPSESWGTYDAVVASHVLEHMPDAISFMLSCQVLLKPTGRIILALPDKRYCFDFFGALTTTGDMMAAHVAGARIHSNRTAFNGMAYAAKNNNLIAWGQAPIDKLELVHSIEEAKSAFDKASTNEEEYVDYHAWRFVPSSFALIILELSVLGLIKLKVENLSPANGLEFYVDLVRGKENVLHKCDLEQKRMTLLKNTLMEIKNQIDIL